MQLQKQIINVNEVQQNSTAMMTMRRGCSHKVKYFRVEELDKEANDSDQWVYVTDLTTDYLDRLDQSKWIMIHVNRSKSIKLGQNME